MKNDALKKLPQGNFTQKTNETGKVIWENSIQSHAIWHDSGEWLIGK